MVKNPKEEQKQLDKISAQIKGKKKEIEVFDKHMETELAKLDTQRSEIIEMRENLMREGQAIGEVKDKLEKRERKIKNDIDEIQMKRVALDKLAEASDRRLIAAKAIEEQNKKTLRLIESKKVEVDDNSKQFEQELQARIKSVDALKELKQAEFLKAKDQFEALQREREEIRSNKESHEQMVKEVSEAKAQLNAQLNQIKDEQQRTKQLLLDIKNREHNCDLREKELKDERIEIDAMWHKVNRKAEIIGFEKELEEVKT